MEEKYMIKTIWDISYQLEGVCEKVFKCDFAQSGTIFDRCRIENDMFYDVMALLLHICCKNGEEALDFVGKYYTYKGKNMSEIPNYADIFAEFKDNIDFDN